MVDKIDQQGCEQIGDVLGDLIVCERDSRENFSYIIVREGKGSKRRTVPMRIRLGRRQGR